MFIRAQIANAVLLSIVVATMGGLAMAVAGG
jgi:hypothetical protein